MPVLVLVRLPLATIRPTILVRYRRYHCLQRNKSSGETDYTISYLFNVSNATGRAVYAASCAGSDIDF